MAREAKAKRVYFYYDDNGAVESEGKQRLSGDKIARLEFQFNGGGTYAVNADEFPIAVQTMAMYHGLSQKLGDEFSGAKSVEEAEEAFVALLERLKDGDWATERGEAGPRTSLIFEAVCIAYERAGKPLDDDRKAAIREGLKDNETRKKAMAKPEFSAVYLELQAKKAMEKAKKAADAVAEAGGFEALFEAESEA